MNEKEDFKKELERQRKVIDKLQETVKLLRFDVSENLKEIGALKNTIKRRKKSILEAIKDLEKFKDKKLKDVIFNLKMIHIRENEEDEQ